MNFFSAIALYFVLEEGKAWLLQYKLINKQKEIIKVPINNKKKMRTNKRK